MEKRSGPRPYPSMNGRPFLNKKPTSTATANPPFPGCKPNPSHKPIPIPMAEECENCRYDHFYYSSECDDRIPIWIRRLLLWRSCDSCDKSLQPEYPTHEFVVTEALETTTPAYSQKTVTVPREGCEGFLENNPTCTYCETTATSFDQGHIVRYLRHWERRSDFVPLSLSLSPPPLAPLWPRLLRALDPTKNS